MDINAILNNPTNPEDGENLAKYGDDQVDRSGSALEFVTPHKFPDEKNDSGLLKDRRWHIVHRIQDLQRLIIDKEDSETKSKSNSHKAQRRKPSTQINSLQNSRIEKHQLFEESDQPYNFQSKNHSRDGVKSKLRSGMRSKEGNSQ